MRTSTGFLPPLRAGATLATVLATAVVLTGCGGGGGSGSDAGAPDASSPAAAESTPADLSTGLLQAESFGPEATVVAVSLEQLQAGTGLAAMAKDLTISPPACATAVQGTQPELDAFDDVAGVSATTGATATVEVLLRGGPTAGSVARLSEAVDRCPEAQISSAELGQVTVRFEALAVPELGDGAAAMRYTTSIALSDGGTTTVPALLGAVEDGDRLVVLTSLAAGAGAAPGDLDPAAFTSLLEEAYEVQADALG